MNKPDTITSTAKLLDIIKEKRDDPPPDLRPGKVPGVRERRKPRRTLPRLINLKGLSSIGIDIGDDCLRLVRAHRSPGGQWQVEDLRKWDIPASLSPESPKFGEFLEIALDTFVGSSKQARLWATLSTEHVDVHSLHIPKLPKQQIPNAVFWTLKKNTPFDEQEMIFDFELRGEAIEQGIPKLAVLAYIAPRREIEGIKSLFAKTGYPLTGISLAPFALQNLFRTGVIDAGGKITASLYLGNNFSRIDIFSGDNLILTRVIKAGNTSMSEALADAYNNTRANGSSLAYEQGRKILFSLCPNSSPLLETDAGFGLEEKEIFEMIQPALERIAHQTEMTFKYFSSSQPQQKITNIFLSGALSACQPLRDYIGAQLEMDCSTLNPLSTNDAGPVCEERDDRHCLPERIAFTPAFGVALSDNNYTPNLIFTTRDKEREASVQRINRGVLAAFIATAIVFGAVFLYQKNEISNKRALIAGMERTLDEIGTQVDRNQLLKMAGVIGQQKNLSRIYADRYLGMALISELAALTPSHIRLVDLKMNLGRAPSGDTEKTAKVEMKGQTETVMSVDGLIFGKAETFDTALVGYVMALEASPLFSGVAVQKSEVEPYAREGALHFHLNLKIEDPAHG